MLFILVAMWYAASSQNNAAAYLLMFALTSVFLISIPHTLLNLGGLKATAESAKPTLWDKRFRCRSRSRTNPAPHGMGLRLVCRTLAAIPNASTTSRPAKRCG